MAAIAARQVAVFWDFENCRPSSTVSGNKFINKIRRLVEGYGSVTTFKAYVDLTVEGISPRSYTLHSELQSSGLTLVHCPHNGKKDVADKMMIVDMLAFAIDTPPPAAITIITGDRDFAYAAAVLRLRGYHIIMIAPKMSHASLRTQADIVFDWQKDVIFASDLSPGANCPAPMHIYKPFQQTADTTFGSTPSQRFPGLTSVVGDHFPTWINEPTASSYTDPKRGHNGSPVPSQQAMFSPIRGHTREQSRSAVEQTPYANTISDVGLSTHSGGLLNVTSQTMVEETRPSDNSDMCSVRKTAQPDDVALAIELSSIRSPTFSLLEDVISVPSSSIEPDILSPSMEEWSLAGSECSSPDSELVILSDPDFSTSSSEDTSFTPASLESKDSITSTANEIPDASIINDDGLTALIEPAIELHPTVPSSSLEIDRPRLVPASGWGVETDTSGWGSAKPGEGWNWGATSSKEDAFTGTRKGSPKPPTATHSSHLEPEMSIPPSNAESASSTELQSKSNDFESLHSITPDSTKRFQPLIDIFIEMKALKGTTRFLSSEVAAGVLRKDPNFYQKAGVTRLRPYIEEARKAGVIISPGMDGTGKNIWMEINPHLYPATNAPKAPEPSPLSDSKAGSSLKPHHTPLGSPKALTATHSPNLEPEISAPPSNVESAAPTELKSKSDSESLHSITPDSIKRFQPLINFFIEMKASKKTTQILSGEVVAGVLKKDPNFYQKAGVTRLRPYIEEARKAGVIISPGMDKKGTDVWMEINPQLYPANAYQAPEPTPLYSKAGSSTEPHPSPEQPIEIYFSPLIVRLRAENQPYCLLFSQLGEFIKSKHPGLYKQASVAGFSAYLAAAEARGIIRIGSTRGAKWAELMPAHHNPLP